jgi:hypothetical protein
MDNVAYKIVGGKLVIEIDISDKAAREARPSSTGRTLVLASTRGGEKLAQKVGGKTLEFSLNAYLKG